MGLVNSCKDGHRFSGFMLQNPHENPNPRVFSFRPIVPYKEAACSKAASRLQITMIRNRYFRG